MFQRHLTVFFLACCASYSNGQVPEIAPGPFEPNRQSLSHAELPEWVIDAKLGFWSHWGPQAVPGQGDWYARNMYVSAKSHYDHHVKTYGHPSEFGYKEIVERWKAEKFTPEYADHLMTLYQRAGAKFFVAQAHHHDNFDLWDSKHHNWDAVEKGPKKNIFAIWDEAARSHGMRFGLTSHLARSPKWFETARGADVEGKYQGIPYDGADPANADLYHPVDWESPEYGWSQRWFNRVKDVIDQHHPDFIYVDGGIPMDSTGLRLVAHYYNQNMAEHGGKLDGFILTKSLGERNIGMYDIESNVVLRKLPFPWMSDHFMGDWYWKNSMEDGDIAYGTSNFQIDHLIDVVSKNGVVMMNVPQRADGTLHDKLAQTLKEMGDWMNINGEGIYGTRPYRVYGEGPSILKNDDEQRLKHGLKLKGHNWRENAYRAKITRLAGYTSEHLRYTQSKDGKVIYAFILGWPEGQESSYFPELNRLDNPRINSVELLGHGPVTHQQDAAGLRVDLPKEPPFKQAACFKIKL